MATTPRIRTELQATAAEEQGIKYFDVSDPKSGHKMRLYDFEWLVAQRMDGTRAFDEVAGWAKERLGIHPSGGDLAEFAGKLSDWGFFELDNNDDYTPLPAALPAESLGGNGEAKARAAEEVQFEEEQPTMPRVVSAADPKPPLVEVDHSPAPVSSSASADGTKRHPFAPREESVVAPVPRKPEAPKKSSAGSIVGALAVLGLLGGGVVYFQFVAPNAAVHVSVVIASPREVVRLYDGAAPVKKAEPQTLSFGDAGKVTDIVAKDTEVKAGMPLATLDSYGKVEKELADVKDRAGFYEKQLASAKAKNDEEGIKAAEAKVAEKHKLMTDLEAKAAKVRILSPGSGNVSDVLVAVGDDAKAGSAAVKIADKRMTLDFTLTPADAAALNPGAGVQMTPASSPATIAGRVAKVVGGTVTIELLADSTAKPGDSLRLVKSKLQNVVQVPGAAVVKRDGSDTVFVLSNGEAKARKVSVVDHNGADALIQTGLATGDSIIVTGVETLVDGKKATTQQ
jgi:multidrug efflux pump subunit AcrA (membrane-fusion protein)